jgi:N utilization substance protein B
MANRHRGRILAVQSIYAWDMTGASVESLLKFEWLKETLPEDTLYFARLIITGVLENVIIIDESIAKHLHKWDIKRIRRVDLGILRISVYSLLFQKDIPPGVVINEAIEISKEFAQDDSYKFINGVLDGIAKSII